jgi:protein O-GlcNAc transferase
MSIVTIEQALDLAIQHQQAGRLAQAQAIYQQILSQQPNHADALHLSGLIAHNAGQNLHAVELITRAIQVNPSEAVFHNSLGVVLMSQGLQDEAIEAHRKALHLKPDYAEAHYNLGAIQQAMGQLDEAIAAYRTALQIKPDYAEVHNSLGSALMAQGKIDAAIVAFQTALKYKPDYAQAYNNLGMAWINQSQFAAADDACRTALQLNHDYAEAYLNLGIIQTTQGRYDAAIASICKALELKPDLAGAHNNLGIALREAGQTDASIEAYQTALTLNPDNAKAKNNLANSFKDLGLMDAAIGAYREALKIQPSFASAHSNLVYSLQFHPDYDTQDIHEELIRWNQQHAEPLKKFIKPHTNDSSTDRRLRIGYVSPDFRRHCQAFFTVPLFSNHDHGKFEIYCYSNVINQDDLTRRLRGYADVWHSVVGVTDQDTAAMIRNDGIDILVDLTMHMEKGRPLLFARKPAPVQVAWLAYPGTTGLEAMDYRLTDPYLDPLGLDDRFYSEESVCLPDAFWCYDPLTNEPESNALPAITNGYVTFGCLNNFCKVNDGVLELWAKVLMVVPQSHLMLLAPQGQSRRRVLEKFQSQGIDAGRVEFTEHKLHADYLRSYHRIDVGLDTLPYNGHTTSLDSFWMGVPVVTLVGQTVVGRAGWSQLCNLGLKELAAETPEQYVQIAGQLANDCSCLSELRKTLRQRMQTSPLMDAPRFARNVEAAFRDIWRKWVVKSTIRD